jgi:hypothetical protein
MKAMTENFAHSLFKTLVILKPYLRHIVIGGGWVPFLYFHYLAKNRQHTPVLTSDIDLMVRHQVPIEGLKSIDDILTEEDNIFFMDMSVVTRYPLFHRYYPRSSLMQSTIYVFRPPLDSVFTP